MIMNSLKWSRISLYSELSLKRFRLPAGESTRRRYKWGHCFPADTGDWRLSRSMSKCQNTKTVEDQQNEAWEMLG